jgi:hypothetical protein
MSLFARFMGNQRERTSVRLNAVVVTYAKASPLQQTHKDDHLLLVLAWTRKTETVFTDSGDVWSMTTVDGPGVDRIPVEAASVVPWTEGALSVTFPTTLGEARSTVRTTGPGVVRTAQRERSSPVYASN